MTIMNTVKVLHRSLDIFDKAIGQFGKMSVGFILID